MATILPPDDSTVYTLDRCPSKVSLCYCRLVDPTMGLASLDDGQEQAE